MQLSEIAVSFSIENYAGWMHLKSLLMASE